MVVPNLEFCPLCVGQVLQTAGEPSRHVYFPRSGIVSLMISFSDGRTAEAALSGFNTVVGVAAALGDEVALNSAVVQIAGAADKMVTAQLKRAVGHSPTLGDDRRHLQALSAQTSQIAACNAVHSVEERLCRWLLQCRDLLQSNELPLTHEFLAGMLGVRRTSVTLIAGELQKAGLISCRRGRVQLLDLEKISDSSCECYKAIRKQVQRLTGWAPEADQRRCS